MVTIDYAIVQDDTARRSWSVRVLGYIILVTDQAGTELLAYHWHPAGGNRVDWPHLHVADPALNPASILAKAHLPTAQISLQDVIRLTITEFGVPPRRPDWEAVLLRTRQGVE